MPNHETNNVTITGTPDQIHLFIEMAFVEPGEASPRDPENVNTKSFPLLDFELVVPQPNNIERGGCGGGAVNGIHANGEVCWYDWCLVNWGTKWGAYEHSHYELRWLQKYAPNDGEGEIYGRVDLRFETAWSQPTPIFQAIEQRWGVKVHAVTQDEGGFPDVEYGDPYDLEVMRKVTTIEFDSYEREVSDPLVSVTADENDDPLQDAGDH